MMIKTDPAVFAVGNEYQIMVPVSRTAMAWVQIGDELYYDDACGIMRSFEDIRRISVPAEKLDSAREYTLFIRPVTDRRPYFTETEPPVQYVYGFRPVPADNIRVFQIADAHGMVSEPVNAARNFGNIDLLVLNGDIPDHCGDSSGFLGIFEICSRICRGNIPVVFSRGNHDMRGEYAEKFTDFTPNRDGNTYYTFRTGPLWGLVLDCGEDKNDDRDEYGGTIACHAFRRKETAFIDGIIARSAEEYAAEGVSRRLVICHIPFTRIDKEPFDIEQELYSSWVRRLRDDIKPDLILCGHTHNLNIVMPGDELDHFGQPCPVVIGSKPGEGTYAGTGLVLSGTGMQVVFADDRGNIEKTVLE